MPGKRTGLIIEQIKWKCMEPECGHSAWVTLDSVGVGWPIGPIVRRKCILPLYENGKW